MRKTGRISRVLALLGVIVTLMTSIGAQVSEKNITISGVISCALCAGNHSFRIRKGPNQDRTCSRTCLTQGSHYVLVKDRAVYRLNGNVQNFSQFVGYRVIVTGIVSVVAGQNELSVLSVR